MNQIVNTIIAAIVGGVVGAGVVFFSGGAGSANAKADLTNLELAELKVGKLTISDAATLLNKEGKPEVLLKDGSVFAENVIISKKMITRQLQGQTMVANRMLATADDIFQIPMEQWKFYAELGATTEGGGEVIVRSVNGPAAVNRPTTGGSMLRIAHTPELQPQILALSNLERSKLDISYAISDMQRQLMSAAMANPQGGIPANPYNSPTATPIGGYSPNGDTLPQAPAVAQPGASGIPKL